MSRHDPVAAGLDAETGQLRGKNRLRLLSLGFALCLAVIAARLAELSLVSGWLYDPTARPTADYQLPRPDIVDRNGILLASDIRLASLYADPRKIIDVDEAIELLTATMPELDARELRHRLTQARAFVWLKRHISPAQRAAIHNLGIPGVGFRSETRRIYPNQRLAAHVLGFVDVDSRGLAGVEKYLDDQGALYSASLADPGRRASLPADLSIDTRVQHAVGVELAAAIEHYKAIGGAGLVLDIDSGEILALASLPDFDPNDPTEAQLPNRMNQVTGGVFELGSVVKAITFAMAFDTGTTDLNGSYDARAPLVIGRSRINDYRGKGRVLTVPEIFIYSSNVGTARMALDVGIEGHQAFLKRMGLFERLITEIPEAAAPILPVRWSKITTATAAFGHGFAVQPLQGASVVAALLNGGKLIPPTVLKRDRDAAEGLAVQVVKPETSEKMRYLFRLNALKGTAKRAEVTGYRVGGKTGTAQKVVNGRYSDDKRLTAFIGAFPMDRPRYLLMVLLDEPKPSAETHGFATSGWNAVPTAGKMIARIAPLLDIEPRFTPEEQVENATALMTGWNE
ncbi:MAG TPA: penicillin-binding protein 2 [Aestuariivirgaceae bacterium]|nr:penicillin-binding protein 2 [Aestuariivirgaceae bacterium]